VNLIHKFLVRRVFEYLLHGYVKGFQKAAPAVSVEKCIANFYRAYGIDVKTWPVDTARVTYWRMESEFKSGVEPPDFSNDSPIYPNQQHNPE
jgi:hypothetical protein